jgi:hypothetical protein
VRDALVCAPLRVKHIEEPIAAADIDAVAFGSTKRSSASPQTSRLDTSAPSLVENTPSFRFLLVM